MTDSIKMGVDLRLRSHRRDCRNDPARKADRLRQRKRRLVRDKRDSQGLEASQFIIIDPQGLDLCMLLHRELWQLKGPSDFARLGVPKRAKGTRC